MGDVRYYTTPSTVPECVRPSVARDWWRFWNRLRRSHSEFDRGLEFKAGTPLRVDGVTFSIRYDGFKFLVSLPPHKGEMPVKGSSARGCGKPYVYLDELQEVLDGLCVQGVMEA